MEIKQKNRVDIPEEYKWNINNLVATDEVWQDGMDNISKQSEAICYVNLLTLPLLELSAILSELIQTG